MTAALDVNAVLQGLPDWRRADDPRPAIARSLKFADFNAALSASRATRVMKPKAELKSLKRRLRAMAGRGSSARRQSGRS